MNVHSLSNLAVVALFCGGCAADTAAPNDLSDRLAEPIEFGIAADLSVTVVDTRDEVVAGVVPEVDGGRLVVDVADGELRILAFELDLADIDVAADLTGLHTSLHFVDVHITVAGAPAARTTWSATRATAAFRPPLQLDWSLAGPRGPTPLAAQLVRPEMALAIEVAADGTLQASLHAERQGAVWDFGELSLRNLDLVATGAELVPTP